MSDYDDASFNYDAASYCQNDADPTPIITGTAGGNFTSAPPGLSVDGSSGAIDVSLSTPNTYTVTYTTSGLCPDFSNQVVTINANPTPTISESACSGLDVTLDAGPGYSSYSWVPGGDTTQSITVPGNGTLYTVTVTDANGCSGQDFVTSSVCLPPPPDEPSDVYGAAEEPMNVLDSTSALEVDEQLDADTYNVYEGSFGVWYAFDAQSCYLAGTPAGPGRIALDHAMLIGPHWYLVSASNTGGESGAGHDGTGAAIAGTCGANP